MKKTGGIVLGGTSTIPPVTLGNAIHARDSISFSADTPFPRSQFTQALLDVFAFVFFLFFLCALVGSIPLAIILMFFVH